MEIMKIEYGLIENIPWDQTLDGELLDTWKE